MAKTSYFFDEMMMMPAFCVLDLRYMWSWILYCQLTEITVCR